MATKLAGYTFTYRAVTFSGLQINDARSFNCSDIRPTSNSYLEVWWPSNSSLILWLEINEMGFTARFTTLLFRVHRSCWIFILHFCIYKRLPSSFSLKSAVLLGAYSMRKPQPVSGLNLLVFSWLHATNSVSLTKKNIKQTSLILHFFSPAPLWGNFFLKLLQSQQGWGWVQFFSITKKKKHP